MFYAGATFVTKEHAFRTYDWNTATSLLDRMPSSYDLAGEIGAKNDLTSSTQAAA
jgi:4-hydroxyphenylacetate 3-monooxygenase